MFLTRSSNVSAQLDRETQALLASLEERVERRLEELRMSLNANVLKRIRLSSADLKVKFSVTRLMCSVIKTKRGFHVRYKGCADKIGRDDALLLPYRSINPLGGKRSGIVGAI